MSTCEEGSPHKAQSLSEPKRPQEYWVPVSGLHGHCSHWTQLCSWCCSVCRSLIRKIICHDLLYGFADEPIHQHCNIKLYNHYIISKQKYWICANIFSQLRYKTPQPQIKCTFWVNISNTKCLVKDWDRRRKQVRKWCKRGRLQRCEEPSSSSSSINYRWRWAALRKRIKHREDPYI